MGCKAVKTVVKMYITSYQNTLSLSELTKLKFEILHNVSLQGEVKPSILVKTNRRHVDRDMKEKTVDLNNHEEIMRKYSVDNTLYHGTSPAPHLTTFNM